MQKMSDRLVSVRGLAVVVSMIGLSAAVQAQAFNQTSLESVDTDPRAVESLQTCVTANVASAQTIRACSDAIKSSVPDPKIRAFLYNKRASLNFEHANYEDAAMDYAAANRLNPNNDISRIGLGYISIKKGDFQEARKYFAAPFDKPEMRALAEEGDRLALNYISGYDVAASGRLK